jgi:type 1 glutamine amidotransferase
MSASESPIDTAKTYLANSKKYGFMEDGVYTVDEHNSDADYHTIRMLGGVDSINVKDNDFTVVTVEKHVKVQGHQDVTIPKIVKIQISKTNNNIESVLESK